MTAEQVGALSDSMSRRRPNFSTRTAEEDVWRLAPSDSFQRTSEGRSRFFPSQPTSWTPQQQPLNITKGQRHSFPMNIFRDIARWWNPRGDDSNREEGPSRETILSNVPLSADPLDKKDKNEHRSRPADGSKKLGTISGVFVPTTLNVLSILMFLRFGFILGQSGVLGMFGKSIMSLCPLNGHR